MSWDITFCSKTDCKDKECKRNQRLIPQIEWVQRDIWVGNFEECEHWKE